MNADNILSNIDYYLQVRDYVGSIPMVEYPLHMSLIKLVVEKLNQLGDDYRKVTNDQNFVWYEYQFTRNIKE